MDYSIIQFLLQVNLLLLGVFLGYRLYDAKAARLQKAMHPEKGKEEDERTGHDDSSDAVVAQ